MGYFVDCEKEWRDGKEDFKPFHAATVFGLLFWLGIIVSVFWFCQDSLFPENMSFGVAAVLFIGLPAILIIGAVPYLNLPSGWSLKRGLEHLVKANILGHTRWFGLKSDGSQVIVDKPYRAPKPKDEVECWLIIPWGGLFRRTIFRDVWIDHHALRSVKASHRSSRVCCQFTSGQKVDLSIRQFFALLHWQKTRAHRYDLDSTIETVLSQLRSVEEAGTFWHSRFEELAKVADEAVTAIALTRRFVRSRDGGDIRRWLIQQMSRVLSGTNCGLTDKYQELEKREVPADFQGIDRIYRETQEPPPKKCGIA